MADIYIVYTGVDREVARRLHDALEARWAVWWDEQLVGSYPQYIEAEMQKAKCVVYVNSQTARDKDTIVGELEIARKQKKPIIPVLIDDTEAPYPLGTYSAVTLGAWTGDQSLEGWKQLVIKISEVVAPREKPPRPDAILDDRLRLPGLFMSVSSHETQLSPEDAISVAAAFRYPYVLLSAYDWDPGRLPGAGTSGAERIADDRAAALDALRRAGGLILMDSGNYEASRRGDAQWTPKLFAAALARAPHDLACSFDVMNPSRDPNAAFDEIVASVHRDRAFTSAPIVPIIHAPRLAGGHDLEHFPTLLRNLASELRPPLLAIPERELGPGLICRIKAMMRIRAALDALPFYQPVHLLGTGNPWSIVTLTAAGADSFDGLEWCRVVVDRANHRLNHFQHFDFFIEQSMNSPYEVTQAAVRSDDIHFAGKTAIHNLDYYSEIAALLQDACRRKALEALVTSLLHQANTRQLTQAVPDLFK
ncbi:MAG: toll/interleukin-1 receptor domain-containing protein [Brevundimonas aurantiaca]|uniref:toll/interleukin-1 receptor domain-containing protein n=1 Tax=Brevundimonas aurantiaca TaxID=74316 RepID=UPI00403367AC